MWRNNRFLTIKLMSRLNISLLGSLQIKLDRSPLTDFATDKARALLVYLTVESDRPHRREALAGLLWPDQPERKANQNLRQALLHLRQAIGEGKRGRVFLCVTRDAIQINPDADCLLDVSAFTSLIETCKPHRHRRLSTCRPCLQRLAQAVELYRGDFLEQFSLSDSAAFEEWVVLKREWLHRQAVEALAYLSDDCERRGDLAQAREYTWRQVKLEPWREEAHRQLMRLLALDGQRSAALAQYQVCRRTLLQELNVEPTSETAALYEQIKAGEPGGKGTGKQKSRGDLLPHAPTPFVGREQELAELAELLVNPDCRLVTIVGPGGIGKTRLALRAAQDQVGAFAHGVRFVPLVSLSSHEFVAPTLADALGFSFEGRHDPQAQLVQHLRDKEMLLVLDSLEHVLESSDLLAEILKHAPRVMVLATSRERLNLQEEWVYEVVGLKYPASPLTSLLTEGESEETLESYSAITLFRQRARQAQQRFEISKSEAPHVTRICQLVEGMPLGIELAAAGVTLRSCAEIAQTIEHNLDVLTTMLRNVPERHRSMRATLDYSWSLLTEQEQRFLARLSVFRGGFEAEAGEQVAGVTLAALAALVDKSLLRRDAAGRFELHELVRQYAAEKPPDATPVQNQHCVYYAAYLHQREQALHGEGQKATVEAIHAEIENVRATWRRAVDQRMEQALDQSLESLHWFYDMQSWFQEAEAVFGQAAQVVEALSGRPKADRLLGRLLAAQGGACFRLGRYEQARELIQKSLSIFRRLNERQELAFALIALGHVALYQHGRDDAQQCYEESLAIHREIGHARGMAEALNSLGVILRERGQYAQAKQALEEALAIGRQIGNRWRISFFLNNLGIIARMMGDYASAKAHYQESLNLKREFGDLRGAAISLNNLGNIAGALEEFDQALQLHRESMTICQEVGDLLGVARSLNNLGMVAHGQKRYAEARRYHQESLAVKQQIGDQRGAIHSFNHLGQAAVELGEYEQARQEFSRALKGAVEMHALPLALDALQGMAELLARQNQWERSAELASLVRQHPSSEKQTLDRVAHLLAELAPQLPPQQRAAVEKRARSLSLEVAAAELLR